MESRWSSANAHAIACNRIALAAGDRWWRQFERYEVGSENPLPRTSQAIISSARAGEAYETAETHAARADAVRDGSLATEHQAAGDEW
eukprot:1720758-Prymnesium_polylepis.1